MELLRVDSLKKYFPVKKRSALGGEFLKAVDGISFSINENEVFALVGESGCGKSTAARLVLRLLNPTAGSVIFRDRDVFGLNSNDLKSFRRSVQIIFQDPFASLNPRKTVFDTLSEPLKIHRLAEKKDMRNACEGLLKKVGLDSDVMGRYPHEFSGGQRQRICIARALAVKPELIVADEPLSALDVSIQAQILNLLQALRNETGIAFLFISHDLRVVRYFSDNVGVMYLGKIVEHAKTDDLFREPLHPYTVLLLSSAPKIRYKEKELTTSHLPLATSIGDVPSPIDIPSGCPFHPRCPKRFEPCDKFVPELREAKGRLVSCHLWNPWK